MELTFVNDSRGRRLLNIEDARIIWPNFSGEATKFTREGDQFFTLVIPTVEMYEALMNDTNEYGVPWNIKYSEPRTEDEEPFIRMKVKVKFNDYGPKVYLKSGNRTVELDQESIKCLDNMALSNIDMYIRPFDGEANGQPYRAAYLQTMHVTQDVYADPYADRLE